MTSRRLFKIFCLILNSAVPVLVAHAAPDSEKSVKVSNDVSEIIGKLDLEIVPSMHYFKAIVDADAGKAELYYLDKSAGGFVCRAGVRFFDLSGAMHGKRLPYADSTIVFVSKSKLSAGECEHISTRQYFRVSSNDFTDGSLVLIAKWLRELNVRQRSKYTRLNWLGVERSTQGVTFAARFISGADASEGLHVSFDFDPDTGKLNLLQSYNYVSD
jgi:hypothetical protein